jgi:carboxyl-terminal processing protease
MIRFGVLVVLLLLGEAKAGQSPAARFDPQLITAVYTEALSFMAPRILEPVPVSKMTIWGLRGLTALDPDLATTVNDRLLVLIRRGRIVHETALPRGDTLRDWVAAAVDLAAAGYDLSPAVRRAGTQGIIQAFFDELFNHLDPYSRYAAPAEAGEDRARRSGRAGIGMTVARRDGQTVAQTIIGEGPAAVAGVREGDLILAVNGQPTRGQDLSTVAAMIGGGEGTALTLTWRGRDGRTHTMQLTRMLVPPETVFSHRSGDVLTIRVTGFSTTTDLHLSHAVQDAMAATRVPSGIVLDLRGNRGGLVRQAVMTADTLLPAGIVAMAAGRAPESNHIWRSSDGEQAEGFPVVVIVDGRTASAAEILAGALADRGRAVVVGSSTLGKGLVQTIDPMPDGGELFVTWSRVLAPRGWPIQGLGVFPQVCTSLGRSALDRQLAELASGVQPMAQAVALHRAMRAPLPPAQIQAIRKACPAAEGGDSDTEAARMLVNNPAAYAAALLPPMRDMP